MGLQILQQRRLLHRTRLRREELVGEVGDEGGGVIGLLGLLLQRGHEIDHVIHGNEELALWNHRIASHLPRFFRWASNRRDADCAMKSVMGETPK